MMSDTPKKRVAILISGQGSNMQALIKASRQPNYPAEILLVLSNKADALGLKTAKSYGIETHILENTDFSKKADYDNALHEILLKYHIDIVCLAGFMRLLGADFCEKWEKQIINIHPSLLPSFRGLDTYKRALDAGVKFAGCSVHYVNAGMDEGAIIAQAALLVRKNDTAQSLKDRILTLEHRLYPQVLQKICEYSQDDSSFFDDKA